MLQLNLAIEKWLQQCKEDEQSKADMAFNTEYTPTDELRDVLTKQAPLSECFPPSVKDAFGKWLAEPFMGLGVELDLREPSYTLFKLAVPFFYSEMSEVLIQHDRNKNQQRPTG